MPQTVHLAFGKTGIEIELMEGFDCCVIEARSAPPLEDALAAIEKALDAPIDSPPLVELARGKASAAISVCDITRPAPNRIVLPPVLRRLEQAGIDRSRIVILIATGLHRGATASEMREIVGEEILAKYRVENHDARRPEDHSYLGQTSTGTPIHIDKRFVSAELRLSLGFIEPHLMAGYSGGRKLIVPGLASQETIKRIHSPRFMRDPRAVEASIDCNPLHRELVEIATRAGHQFIVDVALAGDRRIAAVFAGAPAAAHRCGTDFVASALLQELAEPVDAVITTSAGYPLDLTYYQTVKGVTAASHLVRDGGRILLIGECAEGLGGPEFSRLLLENSDPLAYLDSIEGAPEVTVDQWQLEKLAIVIRRSRVSYCVPGVAPEIRGKLWGPAFGDIREAVRDLFAGLPPNARVAVIPEGPYVLVRAARDSSRPDQIL